MAKAEGRNRVVVHTGEWNHTSCATT
jgi:hypothetical protein